MRRSEGKHLLVAVASVEPLAKLRRFLFSRHGSLRKAAATNAALSKAKPVTANPKKSDADRLILVLSEVTNVGSDRSQLARMAQEAKVALKTEKLDAVADRGYFNGEEILVPVANSI
jgi:hypothetical protein